MSIEQIISDYVTIGFGEDEARLLANVGRWREEPIRYLDIRNAGTGTPVRGGGRPRYVIAAAQFIRQ